jgi:hypothetical protein
MTVLSLFTLRDWLVFAGLFVLSMVYAWLLQAWWRRYPQSYESLTWLQVIIGTGYVVIGLGFILPLEYWLKVCGAFFFACLAIVARSVFIHSVNQRDAEGVNKRDLV